MKTLKPTIALADLGAKYGDVLAWIVAYDGRHELATSLTHRLVQFKLLTAQQLETVQRVIEEEAEAMRQAAFPDPDGVGKVQAAFSLAVKAGVKNPHLHLSAFIFSLARPDGPNAGAIHIRDTEQLGLDGEALLLGRIMVYQLATTRDCTVERRQQIVEACADPVSSAIIYGHYTGKCAACDGPLKTKSDIKQGIHLSCARQWFDIAR